MITDKIDAITRIPETHRFVMGTVHGTEIFAMACPDVSRETAASIARFCREA